MDKDAGIHKDQLKDKRKDKDDDDDSSGSSVSDGMSAQTKNSGNSFFDPPLENYRFYYQGDGGNGSRLGGYKSFGGSLSGSIGRKSDNRAVGLVLKKKQHSSFRHID